MATIQGIYIALFGRPADPNGLAFFDEQTKHGADLTAIGDLASQREYLDRFTDMSNDEIINSIYQSLFNRDAEPEGLAFFAGLMEKGTLTVGNIAIAILDGAREHDLETVEAKVAFADDFTAKLISPKAIGAYIGDAADEVRGYLATVGAENPGTADNLEIIYRHLIGVEDPTGPEGPSDPTGPSTPSSTIFTTGEDHFTDTDGSRAYTATLGVGATLTANDSLHGAGNSLDIRDNTGINPDVLPSGLSLTGISNLSLTTAGNAGDLSTRFDLSGIVGLSSFNLDASGTADDFIKAGSGIAVTASASGSAFDLTGGAASLDLTGGMSNLSLSGNIAGDVTLHDFNSSLNLLLNGSAITGTIDLSQADNNAHILNVTGTATNEISSITGGISSLTVSGDVDLGSSSSRLSLSSALTSVDLSADTGATHLKINGTASSTIRLGSGDNDIVDLSVAGSNSYQFGGGNNSLSTSSNGTGGTYTFGTGINTIDLHNAHAGATINVGNYAAFDPSTDTPNLFIKNAPSTVEVALPGLVTAMTLHGAATSLADLEARLTSDNNPGEAVWAAFDGNTYIVYSSSGQLSANDVTIIGISGDGHTPINPGAGIDNIILIG